MQRISPMSLEPNVFQEYFGIVRKRAWLIIALVIILVSIAAVGTFLARPIYQAQALLLIEAKGPTSSPSSNVSTSQLPAFNKAEILQTQSRIIQSQPLLEEVALALELDKRIPPDDFTTAMKLWLRNALTQVNRFIVIDILGGDWTPPEPSVPAGVLSKAVADLKANVSVAPVVQTDLVQIEVTDYDPAMAGRIANTLAQIYVDRNASLDSLRADTAYQLINKQLEVVEPQLSASEEALKEYKEEQGYLSITEKATNLTNALAKLEADYNESVIQRIETEEKLAQTKARLLSISDREQVVTTSSDDALSLQLKSKLLSLESQLAGLVAYQAQAPTSEESARTVAQISQVSAEINQVKGQLASQIEKEVSTSLSVSSNPIYQNLTIQVIQYDVTIAALQSKEEALSTIIEQHQAELAELATAELALQRLNRTVSANTNIYSNLLQEREQAEANAAIKLPNVRIIEAASIPQEPTFPNLFLNIIAAGVAGVIFGIGLAFWLDYLDESIRSQKDITTYLDLPLFGTVPTLKS